MNEVFMWPGPGICRAEARWVGRTRSASTAPASGEADAGSSAVPSCADHARPP